jgi:hypothetical protein
MPASPANSQGAVFGMCFGSVSNPGFHVGMIVGTGMRSGDLRTLLFLFYDVPS